MSSNDVPCDVGAEAHIEGLIIVSQLDVTVPSLCGADPVTARRGGAVPLKSPWKALFRKCIFWFQKVGYSFLA